MNEIELTGVTERDVDLLVVEEIMSDSGFLSWLLGQIGRNPTGRLSAIGHSVSTSTGESDIELDVSVDGSLVKILIEDKIDAPFQPNRAERYSRRASGYKNEGKYAEVVTALLAPDDYGKGTSDAEGFDRRVSLEKLLEWFSLADQLGNRRFYKSALLRSVISDN